MFSRFLSTINVSKLSENRIQLKCHADLPPSHILYCILNIPYCILTYTLLHTYIYLTAYLHILYCILTYTLLHTYIYLTASLIYLTAYYIYFTAYLHIPYCISILVFLSVICISVPFISDHRLGS